MSARWILLAFSGLLACGPANETGIARTRQAVIEGSASPDGLGFPIDRLQRNAVLGQLVKMGLQTGQGCSGTLVGDRLVVSAGHCVVLNQDQWFNGAQPQLVDAGILYYAVGDDVRKPDCLLAADSVHLHPQAKVIADGSIAHDVSLTILKESALAKCRSAVPLQINRDPLNASLVGEPLLQGGFGSLDGTYNFSPVRNWSLLEVSAVDAAYVNARAQGHGTPTFGDSGSGLLRHFPDGSLRVLGVDSLGMSGLNAFMRLDPQGSFLDSLITPELLCGSVTDAGTCRGSELISCGSRGFLSLDCSTLQRSCAVDDAGKARCVSDACACDLTPGTCDPDCSCDPDCACVTKRSGGCAAAGSSGASGALGLLIALAAPPILRRRLGRRAMLAALALLAASALGCSGSETTVCSTRDAGEVEAGSVSHLSSRCRTTEDLFKSDACPAGLACDIAALVGDAVGCRTAGSTAAYAECRPGSPPCVAGTTCRGLDPSSQNCLPFCKSRTGTCSDGICVDGIVPATGLCLPYESCSALTGAGCPGALRCYLTGDSGRTICLPPGSAGTGGRCASAVDCQPGNVCLSNKCAPLCSAKFACPGTATCQNVGAIANQPDLGICQ